MRERFGAGPAPLGWRIDEFDEELAVRNVRKPLFPLPCDSGGRIGSDYQMAIMRQRAVDEGDRIRGDRPLAPSATRTMGGEPNRTSPGSCDQLKSGPDRHGHRSHAPRDTRQPGLRTRRPVTVAATFPPRRRARSAEARRPRVPNRRSRWSRCRHRRSRQAQRVPQPEEVQGCCARNSSTSQGSQDLYPFDPAPA